MLGAKWVKCSEAKFRGKFGSNLKSILSAAIIVKAIFSVVVMCRVVLYSTSGPLPCLGGSISDMKFQKCQLMQYQIILVASIYKKLYLFTLFKFFSSF